jgi:GSCFA family
MKEISFWRQGGRRLRHLARSVLFIRAARNKDLLLLPRADHAPMLSFYDEKDRALPRFVYRRLWRALGNAANEAERRAAIEDFRRTVEEQPSKGDFLKLKWCLPDYLRDELDESERAPIDLSLEQRRSKRNRRYIEVYPTCADEFSLHPDFLNAAFHAPGAPVVSRTSKVFTLGSCFARNIAVFLESKGYDAEACALAEDLTTPLSNARMLAVAAATPQQQRAYIKSWLRALEPDENESNIGQFVDREIARLSGLVTSIRTADLVIVTIGSIFDFFIEPDPNDIAPEIPVAPRFFGELHDEDVAARGAVGARLKARGAKFRMATFAEAKAAIARLYETIRRINPDVFCVLTLSPVPIDSAIGVEKALPYGAIELDCISKSTLRAALHELFAEWSASDPNLRYFPSYEIVRWVGSMLSIPNFGFEDAASRHVSAEILNAVYSLFLRKFGAPAAAR